MYKAVTDAGYQIKNMMYDMHVLLASQPLPDVSHSSVMQCGKLRIPAQGPASQLRLVFAACCLVWLAAS